MKNFISNEPGNVGLTEKEIREYSFLDVIRSQIPGHPQTYGIGLVRSASAAYEDYVKHGTTGIFVPPEVQTRDLSVGTDTAGGYSVGNDMQSFIDMLRNSVLVEKMGATVIDGLHGDVSIPRQSGASTAYWVTESGALTESQQTFEQVGLTPKTVGAYTDMSRKLINQSSVNMAKFVENDLATTLGVAIDLACFDGSGAAGQPTGISQVSGIGSVTWGAASTPTWLEIIEVESELATDNALNGKLAYVANGTMRGVLKGVAKDSGSGQFAWDGDKMNGYPAYMSNQVQDDDVFFGNWSDLLIAYWSTLEVLVDPYTGSTTGNVRVRCMKDVDIAVRHAESFVLGSD
jgi:HK97 family phage major capsid protein